MQTINRDTLQEKMNTGDVKVVDVLGADQYNHFHLPGAINVPLGEDFESRIQQAVPDKQQEVVVYCADSKCPASPEAAKKMDSLGYQNVYDYEAGKADWRLAGLAVESENE